jgi:ketosteroid isomerase-like protein
VARARRHVDERRPRFEASQQRREQLARSVLAAVSNGDLQALEELLAHDVMLHGDGGGWVRAIARPVHGRAKVARVLLSRRQPAADVRSQRITPAGSALGSTAGLTRRSVRLGGENAKPERAFGAGSQYISFADAAATSGSGRTGCSRPALRRSWEPNPASR